MNADAPTPVWFGAFSLGLLCVGLIAGSLILAVVLLARRSSPRPRRDPAPPSSPAGPGYKFLVAALVLGLAGMTVLNVARVIFRKEMMPGAPDWQVVMGTIGSYLFVGLVVGAMAVVRLAWLAMTRPRPGEQAAPSVGIGFILISGLWVIGGTVVGVPLIGYLMTQSGDKWLGSSHLGWADFLQAVAPAIPSNLIFWTVIRWLWLNRRRFAASVRYAHEVPPKRATPILPSAALSPPAPPRVCPKCGAAVAADAAQGLCPRCLLGAMMPLPERLSPTIAHGPFVPPTVEEVAEFFPQFEVLRIVGQGGMGAVYLARQKALDRIVAIKLIRTAHEDDPTFAARFAREARAMAKLSHPNIVAVHDTGEAGGLPYLVMEYVDGVTLRDAIRTKTVTPAEALAIVPQICDALEYAHKQGVVHRDIKPENILLDAAGKVKIADFGLAKLTDPDSMSLTGTMQAMGTPHYMAPEQWEKPGEVDHRADIYALGVVLYELLTGELPLGRFDPPSVKSRVDARIDELVLRALAKEPDRRYQHATDVKLALAQIAATPGWVRRTGGWEYKSKATLLGWPLVHVVSGRNALPGQAKVAKGWIAVSDGAAVGGIAVGGVTATGGIAVGGAMALGGIAVAGGCAGGIIALGGGVAVGALAAGAGGAAAAGGFAVAGGIATGTFALAGGVASGEHVWASNRQDQDFGRQFGNAVTGIRQAVAAWFRR